MKRDVPKVYVGEKELKGVVGMRIATSRGIEAWHKAPENPTGSDDVIVDKEALGDHLRSQMPSPEHLEGE